MHPRSPVHPNNGHASAAFKARRRQVSRSAYHADAGPRRAGCWREFLPAAGSRYSGAATARRGIIVPGLEPSSPSGFLIVRPELTCGPSPQSAPFQDRRPDPRLLSVTESVALPPVLVGARHARDSKIYLTTAPNHPASLLGLPIAHGNPADRQSPRGL